MIETISILMIEIISILRVEMYAIYEDRNPCSLGMCASLLEQRRIQIALHIYKLFLIHAKDVGRSSQFNIRNCLPQKMKCSISCTPCHMPRNIDHFIFPVEWMTIILILFIIYTQYMYV